MWTNEQKSDLAVCSECGAQAKLILLKPVPEEWYVRCDGDGECISGPVCTSSGKAKSEWGYA